MDVIRMRHVARVVVAVAIVGMSEQATAQSLQLFMSVNAPSGEPVLDIKPSEIRVEQASNACDVSHAQVDADGMKVALLVDVSGNVTDLNALRAGLHAFLDALPVEHEVGLYSVSGQAREREAFTDDRERVDSQVDELFAESGTGSQLVRGIIETWERRFDEDDAWPVFVVVAHEGSETSQFREREFNEFVNELVGRGATFHAVVVSARGGGLQTNVAMNLTGNTGGVHHAIATPTALSDTLTSLAEAMTDHYADAGHRYRVVFRCEDYDPTVQINAGVTRPGAQVRLFANRWIGQ